MRDARRIYYIHQGTFAFALALAATLNIVWQVESGLTPLQLILIGTVLELTAFLLEVPTGIVADLYSRRLSVILGVFLFAAGWTLEGAVPAFWAFLLANVLWGTGYTFISGAHQAWIADEVGEAAVVRVYLTGAQIENVARIVAIPIAAVLASAQLNLPILLGGGLFLLLGLFLVVAMPETGFRPTPLEERAKIGTMVRTFAAGVAVVRLRPILAMLLAAGVFIGLASEGIDRLSTPHLLHGFALPLPRLGPLEPVAWFAAFSLAIAALSALGQCALTGYVVASTESRLSWLVASLAIVQVGATGYFALTGDLTTAAAAFVTLNVLRGIAGPIHGAWLNQGIDPRVRATVLSIGGQADALGQIAGGPLVGAVATMGSIRAALLASTLLLLPVPAVYALCSRLVRPALKED